VLLNRATLWRVTGKNFNGLKITKPLIDWNRWKVKGHVGQGAERHFAMFLIHVTAAYIIPWHNTVSKELPGFSFFLSYAKVFKIIRWTAEVWKKRPMPLDYCGGSPWKVLIGNLKFCRCKTQTADRRQNADCRPGVKCTLQTFNVSMYSRTSPQRSPWSPGGIPRKVGWECAVRFSKPAYPIYDQNLRYSLSYLWLNH